MRRDIQLILGQAAHDYGKMQYNTVVSASMKMLNTLEDFARDCKVENAALGSTEALREGMGILLRILYPVTPHITHTLWDALGYADEFASAMIDAPWPAVDESALIQDEIELVVQVNGKLRASIRVPTQATDETIRELAMANEHVARFATGTIRKFIVVPGRLVNIVV